MKVVEKIRHFWNVTLGPDYPDEQVLDTNSIDTVISELAHSQERIDEEVNKYSSSGKSQRKEMLKATRVDPKDLKTNSEETTKSDKTKKAVEKDSDREIGD